MSGRLHMAMPQNVRVSHQGYEGWFPECLVCGLGNLSGIICLSPVEDDRELTPVRGASPGISDLTQDEHGHWWKACLLCSRKVLSDPFSWGSLAYCIGCWNHFTSQGIWPPQSVIQGRRMPASAWQDWNPLH